MGKYGGTWRYPQIPPGAFQIFGKHPPEDPYSGERWKVKGLERIVRGVAGVHVDGGITVEDVAFTDQSVVTLDAQIGANADFFALNLLQRDLVAGGAGYGRIPETNGIIAPVVSRSPAMEGRLVTRSTMQMTTSVFVI